MQKHSGANSTTAEKQKGKVRGSTAPFEDVLRTELQDREVAIGYVNAFLAEDDEQGVLLALRDIADAFTIGAVARDAGLNRESLYKMLSGRRDPRLGTFFKVLKALGITLRAVDAKTTSGKRTAVLPESPVTVTKPLSARRHPHRLVGQLARSK